MKKSTKLLSVILAIVMLFSSMTVLASAAKTEYKTAENLQALNAYSPYGAVTRLSTEERVSMLFDYLDQVLGDANIKMDPIDLSVLGTLNINLTSVNGLCGTVDNVKSILNSGWIAGLKWMVGIIGDVNLNNWQTGMTREGVAQLTIVYELLEALKDNAGVVGNVLRTGNLDLGVANSFVDLSAVTGYISDIPGLIKGLVFPLFERKDDDTAQINALLNTAGNGGVQSVLENFVVSLFTKPQSTTSYKEDASGKCISNHTLPTTEGTRYYYVKSEDGKFFTCYYYNTETKKYEAEEAQFFKTEEPAGSGEYVFKTVAGDNLKYYENDSYWLPSMAADLQSGTTTLDLDTESAATLLYKFAPYVFKEMAPVVLNGSVKKALAQWFGAKFTYVGEVGSEEVKALPDSSNAFFTQEQGDYLWEWSDYAVINGNHYYRFEDQIFSSDLSNTNPYFDIINWNYKITDDFIDEFIPSVADGKTASAAGYTTVLQAANDFLGKVLNTVLAPSMLEKISWVKGDNSKLLENAKKAAREIVSYSPESIFGENYNNGYYQLMMDESSSNQEIVCGIAAKLIELLMPQLVLPSAENLEGQNVGALLAAILRELATQFVPTYNYDALIYSDYNNKVFLSGKDNSYWLDVCLTIGVDIGMSYLRNLADLGEDTDVGYKFEDAKTYELATFEANPQKWEETIDWLIDWALSDDYEWTWKMEKFVDCGETVDLATAQDPWVKLDNIIRSLLPVEQILNVTPAEGKTWLETALRDNFVVSLLNLDVVTPVSMFNIPENSVLRTKGVFPAAVEVVRDLINGLFYKAANGNLLDPSMITSIDSLFNQSNLASLVEGLLTKLYNAYNRGLLDAAMPLLNFFVGWTTDAQKMANPNISFANQDGRDYMYTNGSTVNSTLNIRNDSSGMLLKHRESDVIDQAYDMVIESVASTDGTLTANGSFPITVNPGAKVAIPVSMPYNGDKAVAVEITYHYVFKNGQVVGGTQKALSYQYVSNTIPESETAMTSYSEKAVQINNTAISKVDAIRIKPSDTAKYVEVTSLAQVGTISVGFTNTAGESYSVWVSAATPIGNPAFAEFQTNYVHGSNQNSTLTEQKIGFMDGETKESSITPYKFNANVDTSAYVSGQVIDLGNFTITWHNVKKGGSWGVSDTGGNNNVTFAINPGDLYFKDTTALQDTFNSYKGLQRDDFAADADAEWTAFQNAMLAAERTLLMPFKADTFATEYSVEALETLVTNLNDAYEALSEKPNTSASYTVLEDALKAAEPEGTKAIDYQDYELFEYWDYEESKKAAQNMIAEYQGPEAPDKYIDGCGLSEDEINTIADAAGNATLTAAIKATMLDPSEDDLNAYAEAVANYQAPTYSALDLGDAAEKIEYYKQFLIAKTTEKQFLAKEIAAANAQGYVEGNYSADSWAAYQAALANANTVNNDPSAKQSTVFDAKYQLMVARNDLMPKADSAKDQGAYMQLESLIAQADVMFQNTDLYTVKDGDAAEAWANLVAALGYEYEDENGDTQNLYADSAKAFVAEDRVMGSSVDAQISAQVAALQNAINQFTCAITVVPDDSVGGNTTEVEQTELVIDGLVPAEINSSEDLLKLVKAAAPEGYDVTLESVASAAGYYGTGATVKVNVAQLGGQTVATYTVVIYGDVNGDGAVDAFDAAVLDLDLAGKTALTGAYDLAADTNADAQVAVADYTLVKDTIAGTASISQTR